MVGVVTDAMLVERINDAVEAYRAAFFALMDAKKALQPEPTRERQERAAERALALYTAKGYTQGWLDAFAFVCPERAAEHRRLAELWRVTLRHAGDPDAAQAGAQNGGDA